MAEVKRIAQTLTYFEEPPVALTYSDEVTCQGIWRNKSLLQRKSRSRAFAAVAGISSLRDFEALIDPDRDHDRYHFSLMPDGNGSVLLQFIYPYLHTAEFAVFFISIRQVWRVCRYS